MSKSVELTEKQQDKLSALWNKVAVLVTDLQELEGRYEAQTSKAAGKNIAALGKLTGKLADIFQKLRNLHQKIDPDSTI